MKKILFIIFLLFCLPARADWYTDGGMLQLPGPVRIFEDIYKSYRGFESKSATETRQAVTLYVRTTGNDNNTGLTTGTALLTPQAAIDRIPTIIKHNVTVDIGEGTFATGMDVSGFLVNPGATLTVKGTLNDPTLGGGTTTGTATGGSTSQCVDAGQAWVANALRGKLVLVGSEYRVIHDNDGTTINLVGTLAATCSGKAYHIYEQKTIIGGTSRMSLGPISVTNNWASSSARVVLQDLKTTTGTFGVFIGYTDTGSFYRFYASGAAFAGIATQSVSGEFNLYDTFVTTCASYGIMFNKVFGSGREVYRIFAYSNTAIGIGVINTNYINGNYWYADYNGTYGISDTIGYTLEINNIYTDHNATGVYLAYGTNINTATITSTSNSSDGVWIGGYKHCNFGTLNSTDNTGNGLYIVSGCTFGDLDAGDISHNSGYGIMLGSDVGWRDGFNHLNAYTATVTVEDNDLGGILVRNKSIAVLDHIDGTNTGYGVTVESGGSVIIDSNTGITGTTADATINGGTTNLTWATHFASNGDKAINVDTGSTIERRD